MPTLPHTSMMAWRTKVKSLYITNISRRNGQTSFFHIAMVHSPLHAHRKKSGFKLGDREGHRSYCSNPSSFRSLL